MKAMSSGDTNHILAPVSHAVLHVHSRAIDFAQALQASETREALDFFLAGPLDCARDGRRENTERFDAGVEAVMVLV
jgi:hypothetical protein